MIRDSGRRLAIVIALMGAVVVATTATGASPNRAPGSPAASPPAVCTALAASPGASLAASPIATPRGGGRSVSVGATVTIRLTDQGFDPAYVEATNGHDLTITLVNIGTRCHGFHLERYGIDITLTPGAMKTVVVRSPDLGDYIFTSDAPGDTGMRGMLTFYI